MTLATRLLVGTLVLVCLLVTAIVLLSGSRLETRLVVETTAPLTREARLIGLTWKPGHTEPSPIRRAPRSSAG